MIATLDGVQGLTAVLTVAQSLEVSLSCQGTMECTLTAVTPELHGTISGTEALAVTLTGIEGLGAELTIPPYVSGTPYSGAYTVTPQWQEQTLETANRVMTDNVTVEKIYINSAENPSGGNTVYIGA